MGYSLTTPHFLFEKQINTAVLDGLTLLHCAVILESESFVNCLLLAGAKQIILDKDGKSSLDYAKETQNQTIITLLNTTESLLQPYDPMLHSYIQPQKPVAKAVITAALNRLKLDHKETFASQIANKLTIEIISLLTNLTLCNDYLTQLNNEVSVLYKESLPIIPPKKYRKFFEFMLLEPQLEQTQHFKTEKFFKLSQCLEQVLLNQENKHGVNMGLTINEIPELFGTVTSEEVDKLVMNNQLWNDNTLSPTGWIHGKYSHRIQHYIITKAIEDNRIDVSFLKDTKGILKNLVYSVTQFYLKSIDLLKSSVLTQTHWQITLDNAFDSGYDDIFSALFKDPCNKKDYIQNLAGATDVIAYLSSESSFKQWPHLASAVYYSIMSPFIYMKHPSVEWGNNISNIVDFFFRMNLSLVDKKGYKPEDPGYINFLNKVIEILFIPYKKYTHRVAYEDDKSLILIKK